MLSRYTIYNKNVYRVVIIVINRVGIKFRITRLVQFLCISG